jgi:hypothetical protein
MNTALRKIAFFIGIGLLLISIYWSQDGFNFDMAGDSGYKTMALAIGWFLAIAVTVMEFVFSSSFKDLNSSLIIFGILSYVYSIYTNYGGVIHFQGVAQNNVGAIVLAIIMDAVPEPLIAWGLYESKTGDLIGNLVKSIISAPEKMAQENKSQQTNRQPSFQSESKSYSRPVPQPQKGQGRGFYEAQRGRSASAPNLSDTNPKINRFNGFGE